MGIDASFEDINDLALLYRFSYYTHGSEPDCTIRKAIKDGSLSEARFVNYLRLKKKLNIYQEKPIKRLQVFYKSNYN